MVDMRAPNYTICIVYVCLYPYMISKLSSLQCTVYAVVCKARHFIIISNVI